MIYVDVIPVDCVCGWLAWNSEKEHPGEWRLVRPEPMCRYLDHHAKESYTQPSLEDEPGWEIRP